MKAVRLGIMFSYLAAVSLTAGTPVCLGSDGHVAYEFSFGECCDPHEDGHAGDEGRHEPAGECLEPGPECGLCDDVLSPLPGGLKSTPVVVAAPSPSIVLGFLDPVESPPDLSAALHAPLPTRFTLRC
jgi:hypothetical protein